MCLLYAAAVAVVVLSNSPAAQNRRSATDSEPIRRGSAILIRTPSFVPNSIDELAERADLIVYGVVESVLPTRLTKPEDPISQVTDSVIAVERVLKGPTVGKVLVSQPGGKWGDLRIISREDPLMQPGERYILFLTRDSSLPARERKSAPERFTVTGAWCGRFHVEGNRIRTASDAVRPGIRAQNHRDLSSFVREVVDLVKR